MAETWGSSALGKFFTSCRPWKLWIQDEQFRLVHDGRTLSGDLSLLSGLTHKPGIVWTSFRLEGAHGHVLSLGGIANPDARRMWQSITSRIEEIRRRERLARLRSEFVPAAKTVLAWAKAVGEACAQELQRRGWISRAFSSQSEAAKPPGLAEVLNAPELERDIREQPEAVREAIGLWRRPFADVAKSINERHLAEELTASRPFFDTVEKSPLTREQAHAVVCFDSRVLLVASAGSGKTSTMVAKAGYALKKGYFDADKVLLLAFNNDASAELRERIKARLEPLGLPAAKVTAKTFHAFGLDVIGLATGKRPTLASWVESGRDVDSMLEMANALRGSDPVFRATWDLFRLVLGQDLPKFGKEEDNPESWDRESGRNGFWTLNNEVVRSRGELIIANWLFYNGIKYVYEAPYKVDTADTQHRRYQPDFYFPELDAYLEHWAINADGEAPADFPNYKEGMAWKRELHRQHGTKLIETTMSQLYSGQAFAHLERELTLLGATLQPDPDRKAPGRQPIEGRRLARNVRGMLTHVKGNRLTMADLRKRADEGVAGDFRFRHTLFLGMFEKLWDRWEQRLRDEQCIDFDDMLNVAADLVEQDRWQSPYELVMVDEFQDASQARARLVAGLLRKPDRHLFAVGDDWQSINRFAGADLSVMTDFEARFGKATTLKLESTFRCPQSLCDISSRFVQKNPRQLRKNVSSAVTNTPEPLRIIQVSDEGAIRAAVESTVAQIAESVGEAASARKSKVFVLGRYQGDRAYAPVQYDASRVDVQYETVHASKGLEADHVIVPRVTSEILGFPNRIIDDPVLQLALPEKEPHEFAEERRLFYVALTRARKSVTLVTVQRKESAFVVELMREHQIKLSTASGATSANELCPSCGTGFLVRRRGRFGHFMGCSAYPQCRHTRNLQSERRSA
jgi:DNA helicase-4